MASGSQVLLVLTLAALALPAHAEVVTLVCRNQQQTDSTFIVRVDYDRKMVADVRSDGSSYEFVPAKITEGDVTWDHVFQNVEVFKGRFGRYGFSGALNRLTGQGWVQHWRMDTGQGPMRQSGVCSRAEKKF